MTKMLFGVFVIFLGTMSRIPGSILRDLGAFLRAPGIAICKFGAKIVENNLPAEVKANRPEIVAAFATIAAEDLFPKRTK